MTDRPSLQMRVSALTPSHMPAITKKKAEPCALVIFGAAGDLTRRKLMPSLYNMHLDGALPEPFAVVGVARDSFDTAAFRASMRKSVEEFAAHPVDDASWESLEKKLFYVCGELDSDATYQGVEKALTDSGLPAGSGRLFYLAVPPSVYTQAITELSKSGIAPRVESPSAKPWIRVVIEKPFGNSLDSARALNATVGKAFAEHQVYRIDHYLGKETVQNLLVFRFANSIFEPIWNREHVDHVQITAAESVGIEHRGKYYEEAGVVRDMFQNHLLQLLTLTAMEPPVRFSADAVRDEKVKVLRAIRPITAEHMHEYSVRGQYGPGVVDGAPAPGYREEQNVAPDSGTPTYAALRFMVDNWRWNGVPFYLRSGKRMPRRATEIAIQFRQPPHLMFPLLPGEVVAPNVLTMRIQPHEGISLCFEVKTPGGEVRPASVLMDFGYNEAFDTGGHDAYETLLLDAMLGEATLFTRSDEVEAAWSVVDPIIKYWTDNRPQHFPNYAAGTWGPAIADEFISNMGSRWREP